MKTRNRNYSRSAENHPKEKIERERENPKKGLSEKSKITKIYTDVKSIPSYSKKIVDFLNHHESSSLFKQVRHKFPRRRVKSYFPYQTLMSDTINLKKYGGPKNKNYKYIMVLVDVFSKKAFAAPMRRMNESSALSAMEEMFEKLPTLPQNLITDGGKEYFNSKMQSFFDKFNVNHYKLAGPHKACIAERFIRTLKGRFERYFWETKTHTWINILQPFIDNYNQTYHRSIKMAPNEVSDKNRAHVFKTLYPKTIDNFKPRLNVGDLVRIRKTKNLFEKGYTRSWSVELYKIIEAKSEGNVDFYKISSLDGHVFKRYKYFWELNLVARNDH